MSGTLQLLCHFAILGATLGLGVASFSDRHWARMVIASLLWIGFWFHLADAAWIPQWGTGRDWIDRVGILVRGLGLALCAFAVLASSPVSTILLGAIGIFALMLGRAMWELMVLPQPNKPTED